MITSNLLKLVEFKPHSLELPNAWVGHLPFAYWLIEEQNPAIFVELGTHSGNSYFSFCQKVNEVKLLCKCFAVDTWVGDEHAGEYKDEVFNDVDAYNKKNYTNFSKLLRTTFDLAVAEFVPKSVNLLHIDGLHTYEAVKHDFETWLPKLAPGAIVLFHDTNVFERNFGVWKFWQELQEKYPFNIEFKHSHGLGVLQLSDVANDNILSILKCTEVEKNTIVDYFAYLGDKVEPINLKSPLEVEFFEMKAGLILKDKIIQEMKKSTSWQITAPMRAAMNFMQGIFK